MARGRPRAGLRSARRGRRLRGPQPPPGARPPGAVPDPGIAGLLDDVRRSVGGAHAALVLLGSRPGDPVEDLDDETGTAPDTALTLARRVAAAGRPALTRGDLPGRAPGDPRCRSLVAVPLTVAGPDGVPRAAGLVVSSPYRARFGTAELDRVERFGPAVARLAGPPTRSPDTTLRGSTPPGVARAVLAATVDGVLVVDDDGRIGTANPAAEKMFGHPPGGLVGRDVSDLVSAALRERHRALVGSFRAEAPRIMGRGRDLVGQRADGTSFPIEVTLTEVGRGPDGGPRLVCAVVRDITERLEYEVRLTHLSLHDPLTGLGNRALLSDRLAQALHRGGRRGGLVALLLCDLDGFKEVNDSLGHAAGDRLLVEVAGRLRDAVRPEDTTARLGGDEFVVVAEQVPDRADALALAERVLAGIRRPLRLDGVDVFPSASIGVALAGHRAQADADGADELLGNADLALYAAKAAGRGRVTGFEPMMRERERGRMRLRADLHRALQRGQLVVHHQPIVDVRDGAVVGVEALVRWQHPERGLLPPGDFLDLAADNELAVDVDTFVLRTACQDVVGLSEAAGRPLEVWVNIGARTLASPSLPTLVAAATALAGLPPRRLVLEVTETAMLTDLASTAQALADLRALGTGLAVDDFGTGHTALTYLTRLPVTAVKLDRSFVRGVATDRVDRAVVTGVARLAEAIGLTTVAEGVEQVEQLDVVTAGGCRRAQGHLFDRAMPTADLLVRFGGAAKDVRSDRRP